MTELGKAIHSKEYIDALADGVDPTSGEVFPEDSIYNKVLLSRCFHFVSDILRQVIDNKGFVTKSSRKRVVLPPFCLPDELRNQIEITTAPAMVTQFTGRINSLIDENEMRKLKVAAVTKWLVDDGFLCEEFVDGKKRKAPTKKGEKIGISSENREGKYGGYLAILYNESAQRFIIKNLDKITIISNGVSNGE